MKKVNDELWAWNKELGASNEQLKESNENQTLKIERMKTRKIIKRS
jgi:hypothetical protein